MLSFALLVVVAILLVRQVSIVQRIERLERESYRREARGKLEITERPGAVAAESRYRTPAASKAARQAPPPIPESLALPPRQEPPAVEDEQAPPLLEGSAKGAPEAEEVAAASVESTVSDDAKRAWESYQGGPRRRAGQPAPGMPDWWVKLQRQLIENWTGVVGAGVLVAGITFVAGYTGLRMSPFNRSLMVAGAGVVLFVLAVVARRRFEWTVLSQWLSSAGAAVVLFACFGSSAIPWLAWTDGMAEAFAVLLVGIAINLAVAHRAGTEPITALHVVLALIPLWLVPQSGMTLGVASVAAASGLALGWRSNWDLSALLILIAYAVFHVVWAGGAPGADPATFLFRVGGTASVALVASLVVLSHYRPGRSEEPVRAVPLVLHILAWGLLAVAIAFYVGVSPLRGILLLLAGGASYGLARLARAREIRWVYLTDVLAAETLVMAALIAFDPWVYHWLVIPAAIFGLALASHHLALRAGEPFLEKVGTPFVHLSGVALFYAGVFALEGGEGFVLQHAGTLLTAAAAAVGYHLYVVHRSGEDGDSIARYVSGVSGSLTEVSLLGVGVGLLVAVAVIHLQAMPWGLMAGAGLAVLVLGLARGGESASLAIGGWIPLLVVHLRGVDEVVQAGLPSTAEQLTMYAPLVVAGVGAIAVLPRGRITEDLAKITVFMVGGILAFAAFTILDPFDQAYPPIAWGGLSLLALLTAGVVSKARSAILGVGFAAVAVMWLGLAFLLLMPSALGGSNLPIRLGEGTVLLTLLLWWRWPAGKAVADESVWRFRPLALELTLVTLAQILVVEGSIEWRALAWGLLALALVVLGRLESMDDRLRFYGVVFFWVALIEFVAVGAAGATQVGVALLALGAQVAFLLWASQRLELDSVTAPSGLTEIAGAARSVNSRLPAFLYYPFFVALAVFLYWRFDAALLTLLWAGEAFLVFAVSLALREGHFRYMALAALAAVVARLILVDMAESNLGLRGVVFIGVGLLMLGMNTLYTRYKDRYV